MQFIELLLNIIVELLFKRHEILFNLLLVFSLRFNLLKHIEKNSLFCCVFITIDENSPYFRFTLDAADYIFKQSIIIVTLVLTIYSQTFFR